MRPIKFRAWDKVYKRMVYQDWMSFRNWYNESNVGKVVHARGFDGERLQLSDPMQFTGLHDKNGKEIWEGDLLIFQGNADALFEVFYDDTYGCFSNCRTHYRNSRCGGYIPKFEDKKFEVIGNIYENQKLLK